MKRSSHRRQRLDDIRQITQILLLDFDQPQTALPVSLSSALIREDLPVPRAPVSSTLLAGRPRTNCWVF